MVSSEPRDRSRTPSRSAWPWPPFAESGCTFEPSLCKYVDKTQMLARLLAGKEAEFGTSRSLLALAPRRVGKTTAIKMLAAMARGEEDKFAGMAVMQPDSPFKVESGKFEVIQLDFSIVAFGNLDTDGVIKMWHDMMVKQARKQHKIQLNSTTGMPSLALAEWLDELHSKVGKQVVVLIDEYDAPLMAFLPGKPEIAEEVAQNVLKPFYTVLKSSEHIHKLFVTGIANCSLTSVFSGANDIINIIAEDASFATLFGFTKKELRDTYADYIEATFREKADAVLCRMEEWYNGYRSHPDQGDADRVYNPWSVLKYLQFRTLQSHWAATGGMQTNLVDLVGFHGIGVLAGYTVNREDLFASISVKEYHHNWQQVVFHSGYATILGHDNDLLQMGAPNREVREWLARGMARYFAGPLGQLPLQEYTQALRRLDWVSAGGHLAELIQHHPQPPRNEADFTLFAVAPFLLADELRLNLNVDVYTQVRQQLEDESLRDAKIPDAILWFRSGMTSRVSQAILMELKFNKPVAEALAQIGEKAYKERMQKFINGLDVKNGAELPTTSFYAIGVAVRVDGNGVLVDIKAHAQ